ncbi:MAG: hypothetical protein A2452_00685 [Candidatus Firestonebacteria bacterium RIFOXYC2_FULL_39_67]|nr:MAG: hypothetical protein A2536_06235 [Candidatus Firestonebacteria bacterium RIFOXYD2_FULL_39_29]OGF53534.1 MAG: hypothetical protein A2497_07705 [Candidatus Firestonebacteria bacterium RifOxyC12_full_39_7]OGF56073.1 MAG: hypothetical protein A2452_00685 [Candidatus Firestonebacteria bacterium RIFOXYC2_FULL_39_67]
MYSWSHLKTLHAIGGGIAALLLIGTPAWIFIYKRQGLFKTLAQNIWPDNGSSCPISSFNRNYQAFRIPGNNEGLGFAGKIKHENTLKNNAIYEEL